MLFQLFLHSTYSLSLNLYYLALEDGTPLFRQVNSHRTFDTLNSILFTLFCLYKKKKE